MADFKCRGYSYELIVRPYKNGKAKYEAIKWKTGFRNLWERISYDEFLLIKSEVIKKKIKA